MNQIWHIKKPIRYLKKIFQEIFDGNYFKWKSILSYLIIRVLSIFVYRKTYPNKPAEGVFFYVYSRVCLRVIEENVIDKNFSHVREQNY